MAGDWIKMRGNLWDDPRVAHICDATGQGEATVVGALYWLWATADQHTESGILPGLTLKAIDRKTGVTGFAAALCEVGWLEERPEGVSIVRFEEHNGASAKSRAMDAKRKADVRKVSGSQPDKSRTENGQIRTSTGARERDRERDSVPNGTGAVAPSEAELTKAELWSAGKSLLQSQGMPLPQCGSFVGKLVKDYGDAVVVEVVRSAVVQRPADVAEWMVAACRRSAGSRAPPNKQEALEARNRGVGQAWLEEQGAM